jgi:hypothetical protein
MAAAISTIAAYPAHATILFSPTNSPTANEQNIMFEAVTVAPSITGDTNQTNTPITFSTLTSQMITEDGIGQANIMCATNCLNFASPNRTMQLTSLEVKIGAGFGATDFVANPDFGEGTMTVNVTDQFGAVFPFVLTKGSNFYTLTAIGGEVITDIQMTMSAGDGWNLFKQPRVSGICTLQGETCTPIPVPEPASIALLGVGLLGLSLAAVRKRRG